MVMMLKLSISKLKGEKPQVLRKIDRRAIIGIGLLIVVLIAIIVAIIIGKHSYKPSKNAEKTTKAEATSEVTTEEPKELTIEEKMAKFE